MRLRSALQLALGSAAAATVLVAACSERDPSDPTGTSGAGGDGGAGQASAAITIAVSSGGPPPTDAELCGNQFHDVEFDSPALYFVLDASGSMAEVQDGTPRYETLHAAIVDLVQRLGDRIRVGAAVFPEATDQASACRPGDEVLSLRLGDPFQTEGGMGPVTTAFAEATDVTPQGGTPTAVTLRAVRRALAGAPGRRAVVLVTDGGPNCNADVSCDASTCIPNIEGACPNDVTNCCDPGEGGTVENCLDRASTLDAIAELREIGITVHVIGISGSAPFTATLGQMAILGGAPTDGPPYYQRADDIETLATALSAVAVVEGSCIFELDDDPPVAFRTNVWLDADRLAYDSTDGWMWRGAPLDYVPTEPTPAASSAAATSPDASSASGAGGAASGAGGAASGAGSSAISGAGGGDEGGAGFEGQGGATPAIDTSAIELRGEACRRFSSGQVRRVQIVTGCPTTTPN